MVLTEPVPDLLEEIGWTGGECITDSRAMVHYMRTTPDGRIAFGWGGGRIACGARLGRRTEHDGDVVGQVASHLRSFFPGLEGRRITHALGRTDRRLPRPPADGRSASAPTGSTASSATPATESVRP